MFSTDVKEVINNLEDLNSQFSGKTVLLTGGSGFLGKFFKSYFVSLNKQLEKPCKIISIDNHITGTTGKDLEADNLVNINHNVIQPFFSLEEDIHYIINACGIASPYHYRRLPLETLDVSYLGTRNMLMLAKEKRVEAFLGFSSSEIYGDPDASHVPTPESYCGRVPTIGERACYDQGKMVIETLCSIFNSKYGINTKIVRPFNVFGAPIAQNDFRVLPNFISKALRGEPLYVYGDGKQTRTFCYVTDFITGAIRVLLQGDNLPYNVGNSDNEITMSDLTYLIEKVLGKKLDIRVIEYPSVYPADEPRRRCPDLTKAHVQLGYTPKVSLEDGIRRFYAWAKDNYV